MAIVKDNIFLEGLAGSVGKKMVIKRGLNGQTIISRKPNKSNVPPSEAQIEHKEKFKEATAYGNSVMADPEKKAAYSSDKKGDNPYRKAVTDYMIGPKINEIDASEYTGEAGQLISIRTSDDFSVTKVGVSIFNPDGTLVEQGLAVQNDAKTRWIYATTAVNDSLEGDNIVVRVNDLPGNNAEKSLGL